MVTDLPQEPQYVWLKQQQQKVILKEYFYNQETSVFWKMTGITLSVLGTGKLRRETVNQLKLDI